MFSQPKPRNLHGSPLPSMTFKILCDPAQPASPPSTLITLSCPFQSYSGALNVPDWPFPPGLSIMPPPPPIPPPAALPLGPLPPVSPSAPPWSFPTTALAAPALSSPACILPHHMCLFTCVSSVDGEVHGTGGSVLVEIC